VLSVSEGGRTNPEASVSGVSGELTALNVSESGGCCAIIVASD